MFSGRRLSFFKYGKDEWGWVPRSASRYRVSGLWGVMSNVGNVSNKREVCSKGMGFSNMGQEHRCQFCFWPPFGSNHQNEMFQNFSEIFRSNFSKNI